MYMETKTTNAIDDPLKGSAKALYELNYWVTNNFQVIDQAELLSFEITPDTGKQQKRLLQHQRTLFRKDDLIGLLPLSVLQSQASGGENYKLAFTKAMSFLEIRITKEAMFLESPRLMLASFQLKLHPEHSGVRLGKHYFQQINSSPAEELVVARKTFFLPKRFRGPFGVESSVGYDDYNFFVLELTDGVGNKSTVGNRDKDGVRTSNGIDYRFLKPRLVTNMNRNQTAVCYDAFGREIPRAAMGKAEEKVGDSIADIIEDCTMGDILTYLDNPMVGSERFPGSASSRVLFDAFAYYRTKDTHNPSPARAYVMQRTEHSSGVRSTLSKVNRVFAYSDGFGRTIQSKIQCRPGPVPMRDEQGNVILDDNRQAITSGWAIFNNKGKVVRAYEPFFTDLHGFEFGIQIGVSSITFYDAAERACAAMMPNNTFTKAVYSPWYQEGWDSGDTLLRDPRTDSDTAPYTAKYFMAHPEYQTWYQMRIKNQLGADEKEAAEKCAAYSETPMTTYFDSLGRGFLTVARHRVKCLDHDFDGRNELFYSRVELEVQGNRIAIRDSVTQDGDQLGRVLEKSHYPMKVWDSRGQLTRSEYDAAGRPVRTYLQHLNTSTPELLIERLVYGESHPEAEARNLRGAIYLSLDQSGMASINRHDFKANTVENSSRLCKEYKTEIDWSAMETILPENLSDQLNLATLTTGLSQLLEDETFIAPATFDALSQPLTAQLPHSNGSPASAVRFSYIVGSLDTIECNIRDESAADGSLLWKPFV
ncbi:hypothetical protein BKA65DRAFT_584937 [Rhexocercosporidium sp. MPI-PUGE-AT-0058]|nr:hypothetical protein BKA65DRAFT_584937 [Rhexocercosporidium sp. MPI-PUGE-AT-0058]